MRKFHSKFAKQNLLFPTVVTQMNKIQLKLHENNEKTKSNDQQNLPVYKLKHSKLNLRKAGVDRLFYKCCKNRSNFLPKLAKFMLRTGVLLSFSFETLEDVDARSKLHLCT